MDNIFNIDKSRTAQQIRKASDSEFRNHMEQLALARLQFVQSTLKATKSLSGKIYLSPNQMDEYVDAHLQFLNVTVGDISAILAAGAAIHADHINISEFADFYFYNSILPSFEVAFSYHFSLLINHLNGGVVRGLIPPSLKASLSYDANRKSSDGVKVYDHVPKRVRDDLPDGAQFFTLWGLNCVQLVDGSLHGLEIWKLQDGSFNWDLIQMDIAPLHSKEVNHGT